MLKFQAVEMAHHDGRWNVTRHIAPLPDAGTSSSSRSQGAALLRDEERDVGSRTMAAAARRPGGPSH